MKENLTLVLLRHGQSEGNVRGIYQGQADFPLTSHGRAQARALAARWLAEKQRFDRIFASPLRRARETAEIIGQALNVSPEFCTLLMERDNGSLQGRHPDDPDWTPEDALPWGPYEERHPGAESDWQLFLRAGRVLQAMMQRPAGRYLLVSHGGLLIQLTHAILGLTPHGRQGVVFRFGNTGFVVFTYSYAKNVWQVHFSDVAHLNGLEDG